MKNIYDGIARAHEGGEADVVYERFDALNASSAPAHLYGGFANVYVGGGGNNRSSRADARDKGSGQVNGFAGRVGERQPLAVGRTRQSTSEALCSPEAFGMPRSRGMTTRAMRMRKRRNGASARG